MGIKSLSKFLHDKYPELFEEIHISEYHFKRVAIDTSLYLYHHKATCGDFWLGAFIKLVATLRENELHCFFSYDTSCPPEKEAERQERKESRIKTEVRVCDLEQALETLKETGEIDPILLEFQKKRKIPPPSMLRPSQTGLNVKAIELEVAKMRKHIFSITKEDFDTTKQLFKILDVPYADAPMEAETLCADLCIQGKVEAVLSEDTDVLAYGAPVFLTKINTKDGTCVRIKYADVLEKLEMTPDMFLDFCIMCGTDYNKNIPKVGPANAYKLILKYGDIETVGKETNHDISILNHVRVRELFRDYKKSQIKVPYCGTPDFQALQKFVFQKNLRINADSLRKSFTHNVAVFESSNEEDEEDSEEEVKVEEGSDDEEVQVEDD